MPEHDRGDTARNIVVLSDGTGQEGGRGHNTNIYGIFDLIEDRTPRQMVFYDAGPGTGWQKFTGNAFGRGFTQNMREAYRFIFEQYQVGDRIYLLGFSRGAATVRSLATFIDTFGILPRSRPKLIEDAFDLYKTRSKYRRRPKYDEKVAAFLKGNGNMPVDIDFVGVYDTVAALGFPTKLGAGVVDRLPFCAHRFHEFELRPRVKRAYQALAIDDARKTFHPLLWDAPTQPDQHIEQVWFAGAHTDVGGGYADGAKLQNIPLVWLLSRAADCGILVQPVTDAIEEDAGDVMHDSAAFFYPKRQRSWPSDRSDKPRVHASVVERSELATAPTMGRKGDRVDAKYVPWILQGEHEVEEWRPATSPEVGWHP